MSKYYYILFGVESQNVLGLAENLTELSQMIDTHLEKNGPELLYCYHWKLNTNFHDLKWEAYWCYVPNSIIPYNVPGVEHGINLVKSSLVNSNKRLVIAANIAHMHNTGKR